jgi:hypothetical protein
MAPVIPRYVAPLKEPPIVKSRTFIVPYDIKGCVCEEADAVGFLVMGRIESMFQIMESADILEDAQRKARKLAFRLDRCSRREGGKALDA